MNSRVTTFSGFDSSYTLPENIAIITLQELDHGTVLLRLAHLYEVSFNVCFALILRLAHGFATILMNCILASCFVFFPHSFG